MGFRVEGLGLAVQGSENVCACVQRESLSFYVAGILFGELWYPK